MPESEIAIKCSGRRYTLLVNSEEFYLCYCEWLFAITTEENRGEVPDIGGNRRTAFVLLRVVIRYNHSQ